MSRTLPGPGEDRVVRLLESLRDAPPGPELDVTFAVLRRIRALPVPRPWHPLVTLRQFGWAASAATVLFLLGTVGLSGALGADTALAPGSAAEAARRTGGILWAASSGLARVIVRQFSGTIARHPLATNLFEGAFAQAAWGAALLCAVALILTILVVSHETRVRRVRG